MDDVTAVSGVERAVGVVKGNGLLVHDGDAIVPRGPSLLSSWVPGRLNGFTLRAGRPPSQESEVVVDVATARAEGIRIGNRVGMKSNTSRQFTVTGLAGFGDDDGLPNTTVALVSLGTARQLLDVGPAYSEFLVVADAGVATGALQKDLTAALGGEYDVSASRDTAAASAAAARNQLGHLRITLFVLAGAALLIGAFLFANTFAMVVTQRTRELALLPAARATGRQMFCSVLGEAALVGAVGGATGALAGVAAAAGLRDLAGSIGIPLPDEALVVEPRTLALGGLIGVGITVVSAVAPARRAARTPPWRPCAPATSTSSRERDVTWALSRPSPWPVRPPGRCDGWRSGAAGRTQRVPGTAAYRRHGHRARHVARPDRVMGAVASSIKASVASTYTEVVTADFVIESARGEMLGGLPSEVHHAVMDLPEVDVVSGCSTATGRTAPRSGR